MSCLVVRRINLTPMISYPTCHHFPESTRSSTPSACQWQHQKKRAAQFLTCHKNLSLQLQLLPAMHPKKNKLCSGQLVQLVAASAQSVTPRRLPGGSARWSAEWRQRHRWHHWHNRVSGSSAKRHLRNPRNHWSDRFQSVSAVFTSEKLWGCIFFPIGILPKKIIYHKERIKRPFFHFEWF